MDSPFDASARGRILRRIDTHRPDSPRGWGKMECAQTLAHCANALEAANGDRVLRRNLAARIIGPLFRG